ncbi:modification methylase HindII [Elysia marginata]|uniref:Modification methylase HindII n=1 Tax=Elysia marginata TaxID=1093978 RepID=A0AAV4HJN2_9GAST|nr:modification methylase HindII [Elysia marginata]
MPATWLNDRDQFLYPQDGWQEDKEFQNDCLAVMLFHGQNRISVKEGVNHWIPFTEEQVDAKELFESHFMVDFIGGNLKKEKSGQTKMNLADTTKNKTYDGTEPLKFSPEAKAVLKSGLELWKYYHEQPNINVNASFYDIRAYFQGYNDKDRMNSKSENEQYTKLIGALRSQLKDLAEKIHPKIYQYGFLK